MARPKARPGSDLRAPEIPMRRPMIRRRRRRCQRADWSGILLSVDEPLSQLHPAGPAKRFLATLIDYPIGYAPTIVVGLAIRLWLQAHMVPGQQIGIDVVSMWNTMGLGGQIVVYLAFVLGGPWYYQAVFESSRQQATLGKRWLGIHVADSRDGALSFGSAFGRSLLKFVLNALLVLFPLSLLTMLMNKDRRALHDFVARTKVFRGRPAGDGPFEPWLLILWPGLPLFAVIAMAALYLQ
jgi:uncharacterized RDD family membrane protein YckC